MTGTLGTSGGKLGISLRGFVKKSIKPTRKSNCITLPLFPMNQPGNFWTGLSEKKRRLLVELPVYTYHLLHACGFYGYMLHLTRGQGLDIEIPFQIPNTVPYDNEKTKYRIMPNRTEPRGGNTRILLTAQPICQILFTVLLIHFGNTVTEDTLDF